MPKPKSLKEREQEARTVRMELEVALLQKQLTEEKLPSPSGPSLNDSEQQARINKLLLEQDALRYQQTNKYRSQEWLKTITGAGSLVAATVALMGILISGYQWFENSKAGHQTRDQERLDKALLLLADKEQSQRLAGVVSLKSFLDREEPSHIDQVLLAFASAMAIEDSLSVRNAIVAALVDIDTRVVEKSHLDRGLRALCETSRGLAKAERLLIRRRAKYNNNDAEEETAIRLLQSTGDAIVALLRKGARAQDMSGVFLEGKDLSGIVMPGTRLNNSILGRADFSNADLSDAVFIGADLTATQFVAADLRNAVFG